jgi:alpha-glucosidase
MPSWYGEYAVDKGGKEATLDLYKTALQARKQLVQFEAIEWLDSPEGTVSFKRGDWQILTNFDNTAGVDVPSGKVVVASGELSDGGKRIPACTTVWVRA